MTILQAIILGIVQGITEFLPISSTAHLIFAGRLLGLYPNVDPGLQAEQTTATIAVMQMGTLVAILIYFAQDILNIVVSFTRDHIELAARLIGLKRGVTNHAQAFKLSSNARLGWLVIIGTLPVGIVGLLFQRQIEGTFTKNLWVIAAMMILIALALGLAERVGRRQRVIEDLQVSDALVVGSAQILALLPGASRSGTTIMGGLFAGQTRETAARFSFLLSIPAIAASGLLELKEAIIKLPSGSAHGVVISTVVSGVVGFFAIWLLLRYLRRHSTAAFIYYRLTIGTVLILLLLSGRLSPT